MQKHLSLPLSHRLPACGVRGETTSDEFVEILNLREGNEESSVETTGCKVSVYGEFDDWPQTGNFVEIIRFRHFEQFMRFDKDDRNHVKKRFPMG